MAAKGLLYGLLAAVAAFPGALLLAVAGQGIGALAGGCGWIGISTAFDRQVWALVNQPTLDFATELESLGYWSGSVVLPLLVAFAAIPLLPRARSLAAELIVVQLSWACAVIGLAWLPLLDPLDGHLSRWLELWRLPAPLLFLAPALAIPAAVPPTLRLLGLLRIGRPNTGRALRLATVMLHLALPAAAWVAAATALLGALPPPPALAVGAAVVVALSTAWFGYPPAFVHRLRPLSLASWLLLAALAVAAVAIVWLAGRPLPEGRRAGLLWAQPTASNNIRPWIDAVPLSDIARLVCPPSQPPRD
ncbi:MAG: hypothetical protein C3F15_06200 [Holophagae bacterium]|nr:MAG: hypothetical protein C3F15_06200 [Holophagae bacterium]